MNPSKLSAYIKNQAGKSYKITRMISSPLYSANLVEATAATGSELVFFSVGVGNTGQGFANPLTTRETNLDTSGKLPSEQVYAVNKIGIMVDMTPLMKDEQDELVIHQIVADFLSHSVLRFEQPGYKHVYGPAWMFPAGGGMNGYSVITNASVLNNGVPSVTAMWHLQLPMIILGGASFQFYLDLRGADGFAALANTAAFTTWVALQGVLATAVVPG